MNENWAHSDEQNDSHSDDGQQSAAPIVASPQRGGPQLPRKLKTIRLPGEYGDAGFRATIMVNVSAQVMDDALRSGAPTPPTFDDLTRRTKDLEDREKSGEDIDPAEYDAIDTEQRERMIAFRARSDEADQRRLSALSRIVIEHNGWCDETGEPYPPANTHAFWQAIPNELASAVLVLLQQEASKLPNSMIRGGRR